MPVMETPYTISQLLKIIQTGNILMVNGGIHMSDYRGIKINAQQSAFALGENHKVTTNNNNQRLRVEDTEELLRIVNEVDLPIDQKKELEELIESATEEASSETPKKTILKRFLNGISDIIGTVKNSPELITAYQKWSEFFSSFRG
jgi:hypothetical protein